MEKKEGMIQPPFYYDSDSQTVFDQKGIVTDIRMWGRLTGIGAMNLPPSVAMVKQDEFGQLVATLLNEQFPLPAPTEDKKAPVPKTPHELAIIKNIWRRAYLDSEEDHVKILKEYGQQIASNERTKAIQECQNKLKEYEIEGVNYLCEQLSKLKK